MSQCSKRIQKRHVASGITKESWFHRLTEIIFVHKLLSASKTTPKPLGCHEKLRPKMAQLPSTSSGRLGFPRICPGPMGQTSLLQPLCDLSDDEGEETKGSTALKGWNLRTKLLGFQELVASPTLVVFQEAWGLFGMKQGMVSG